MTHNDQHTESTGAPGEGEPRTRFVSVRTVLGSAVAVATVAGAGVLGVLTLGVYDESVTASAPASGVTPTCSIWSVPTLEVAPVPQSNLTEGAPYVAVCVDDDVETTFVFLYGLDNDATAPASSLRHAELRCANC